jgi:hypothetical protein
MERIHNNQSNEKGGRSMKRVKWGIVGAAVALAFFMANAQSPVLAYTIKQTESGKNYVVVGQSNTSIQIELDGSKFAEYLMALLTTSVPDSVYYTFKKASGGSEAIEVNCPNCSPYNAWIRICKNYAVGSDVADVAVNFQCIPGGGGWIYLFHDASAAQIMKFEFAMSAIIQNTLKKWPLRRLNVTLSSDNKDFELRVSE